MGVDFYAFKTFVVLLYALFGLSCLYLARAPAPAGVVISPTILRRLGPVTLLGAALLMLFVYVAVGSHLLLGATILAAIVFVARSEAWTTPTTLFGGLSAAVLALSLVWWRIEPADANPMALVIFASILAAVMFGLADPGRSRARFVVWPAGLLVVTGTALLADLGAFRPGQDAVVTLVHHWGAFIGPALHVRAGLVPFFDVPLQYGLGPTLAITLACHAGGCWPGAQFLFTATQIAGALLFLSMALTTKTPRGWVWTFMVTIVVFTTVFFWPGFPARGSALMAAPSSGEFRFLPVTVVACLWFFSRPTAATIAMVPALLWSPESAAMAVAVYGLCGTGYFGFWKAALLSAALLIGSYLALFLAHRAVFGVWIDPMALVEYVIHVPGALPINPFSDILLLAATLGLGGWLVWDTASDPESQRRSLAVTALLFAVSSYTLGRSHPNNVCNLAPFLALVALRALDRAPEAFGAVGRATALGLAVSVAALAFSPWTIKPFDPNVVTDIDVVVTGFPAHEPDVERIRTQVPRTPALGIADFGPNYARHPSETIVWTPMDPSSLWTYVPSERRKIYIERSARRLGRSGWGIFTESQLMFLTDLQAVYRVTNVRRIQGGPIDPGGAPIRYTVACFDPKPEIVTTTTGPACPPDPTATAAR